MLDLRSMEDLSYIAPPPEMKLILEETARLNFGMASDPLVGALLCTLAASKAGGRFLELGTGTGVATAWLLKGMDANSTLVSVDNDEQIQQAARRALGQDPRLRLLTSDGREFMRTQPAASFDLIFADTLPGKYEGLSEALALVKPSGFYVVDNLLPQPNWSVEYVERTELLVTQLAADASFTLLPLVWASGVMVAVKKQNN
jgi:predicted O-methyltransferase YrrM